MTKKAKWRHTASSPLTLSRETLRILGQGDASNPGHTWNPIYPGTSPEATCTCPQAQDLPVTTGVETSNHSAHC